MQYVAFDNDNGGDVHAQFCDKAKQQQNWAQMRELPWFLDRWPNGQHANLQRIGNDVEMHAGNLHFNARETGLELVIDRQYLVSVSNVRSQTIVVKRLAMHCSL